MRIPVASTLHKSFHEAGHIEVAYLSGATVTRAGLLNTGAAVTSVQHKADLNSKKPTACGGLAAEILLFEQGRLVDVNGAPLTLVAFEAQAMANAVLDKLPFYIEFPMDKATGLYPNARFQPNPDRTWPPESDQPFIQYTQEHIVELLRPKLNLLEALAHEISVYGVISQQEIEEIRKDFF